jgi:hypothetical protein
MPKKLSTQARIGPYRFQYAAKFICTSNIPGTSQTSDSVLPGSYQTAVNIHNPGPRPAKLRVKVALGPRLISRYVNMGLRADEVNRIVCRHLRELFGLRLIHGAEGFLVVESTHSLDVVAVYTAGPVGSHVTSIDVERVEERHLGAKPSG